MEAVNAQTPSRQTSRSPLNPVLPQHAQQRIVWGDAAPASVALTIANAAKQHRGLLLVVVDGMQAATQMANHLRFFLSDAQLPVLSLPDWETLPYDVFSPLPELISQRLEVLYKLRELDHGILVVPVSTLMLRLPPQRFLDANSLILAVKDTLRLEDFQLRLANAGYLAVPQVSHHGEFAVRGSLIDLFPMGSDLPYRIDLFDDEVDSIRTFDPDSQRTAEHAASVRLLPAREFPTDASAISKFRKAHRERLDGDPHRSLIYRQVSDGNLPGGIEYYLPLFFDEPATLFDYLPKSVLLLEQARIGAESSTFYAEVCERYEQRRHDLERPLLPPQALYLTPEEVQQRLAAMLGIRFQNDPVSDADERPASATNLPQRPLPALNFQGRSSEPAAQLIEFLAGSPGRVLFVAETAGRREHLLESLQAANLKPDAVNDWPGFLYGEMPLAITVAPLEDGLWLEHPPLAVLPEALLLGERVQQERRRRRSQVDADQVVRNLAELHIGSPVVHEDHGVGRYLGLQILEVGGLRHEFLTIEYAKHDKLYVPVSSLHLISRYTGASPESAPLHRLGTDQWEKAKRKAAARVRDVAAELLDIYARRAARKGVAFADPGNDYQQFAAAFEFEETPDQEATIEAVTADLLAAKPMDRLVCGDVGFGKTEVAMRAAFVAVHGGRQVAVLVPTTLLAQQHYDNFADRFADWPVKIESLSRFRTAKQTRQVLTAMRDGSVDIVVGTHKLLGSDIKFKDLGLVIVDEEHRFGVRHKEQLKALRAEVDFLTLTATPIPRTLNMAMSGIRDLSIIATPPAARHPIKTFVSQWNATLLVEACQREIKRGGQIYFLHNEVATIQRQAEALAELVPHSRIAVAHGQMRETELERVMRDFYHQRFNILVCTTIVESGIDVPTANTIIINRADKLGLAQLHQLRGRVGRSHHRAYAYLITPPPKAMTPDASKRLEAIEALEELGAGFALATHDLEIRGAGELLGDEQSGQIQEIGFTLYSEMLERAVQAIRAGRQPELDRPLDHGTEIDLNLPALLPDDYLPDVHVRLIQYKRIASAPDIEALRELKVEMIDRFGLLPPAAKHLFDVTELKLSVSPFGIRKIEAGPTGGRIQFTAEPKIDPASVIQLIQQRPAEYQLDGADKLRFLGDFADPNERIAKVGSALAPIIRVH